MLLFCELLESAHLERQSFNDSQAVKIVEELFIKHPSLRELSLRWNGVTGHGVQQIARVINRMSNSAQAVTEGRDADADDAEANCKQLDLSSDAQKTCILTERCN